METTKWEPIDEQRERLATLKMRIDLELDTLNEVINLVKKRIGKLVEGELEHAARVTKANRDREVNQRIIELDEKHLDLTRMVQADRD